MLDDRLAEFANIHPSIERVHHGCQVHSRSKDRGTSVRPRRLSMKPVADSEDCDGFAARVTLTWGLELD